MSSEENQQEKLAKAMNLAGLAMTQLGAKIMQFNQKETTVNILLSLKPDADINQIASVILTMKSMLVAVGVSIVKLYHPLEGQSTPKCFRVLELNQDSIDTEKSLVQNQSDNIDSQHNPKLLAIDARPQKIQDQPLQINGKFSSEDNSEIGEYEALQPISNNRYTQIKNKLILSLLIAFLGTFLSFYYKAAIDNNKDLVITAEIRLDSIQSTQADTYQDVQAEVQELENIISDLSNVENKPFFYYPKAQNLIKLAQDIKLEKEKTLEPLMFDQTLKTAYDVAVLTQTAKTVSDWTQVQQGWKSAIDQLASIPESSEKYEQAQQKLGEYQANLSYAEQKLASAQKLVKPEPAPKPEVSETPVPIPPSLIGRSSTGEWFVGGNLHNKTMMEWNRGTADNKLATAGDMASTLLPHLPTPAVVKPYAEDLVICLDETGKKNPNADQNEKIVEETLEDASVAEIASLCANLMGWY